MIGRILIIVALVLLAFVFYPLAAELTPFESLTSLAERYVGQGARELGAGNIVTAVVVTYRGLDTLGEVAVLFAAAAGVGLLLGYRDEKKQSSSGAQNKDAGKDPEAAPASEIVRSASGVLIPMLMLFGAYIFVHGHLTPGGGFQGGVVVTAAFLLILLSDVKGSVSHGLLTTIESLSGAAYVGLGIGGLLLAGGFLDNRFLPMGEVGRLFSAGAIPLIYSFLGLKVGSELMGILQSLRNTGGTHE